MNNSEMSHGDMPMKSDMEDDSADTSSIPASLVDGNPQPGDTISLTVVSVDENNGTITVSKSGGTSEGEPQGSDSMASEFDQPQTST